jgi:uncharacterized membrane protein
MGTCYLICACVEVSRPYGTQRSRRSCRMITAKLILRAVRDVLWEMLHTSTYICNIHNFYFEDSLMNSCDRLSDKSCIFSYVLFSSIMFQSVVILFHSHSSISYSTQFPFCFNISKYKGSSKFAQGKRWRYTLHVWQSA